MNVSSKGVKNSPLEILSTFDSPIVKNLAFSKVKDAVINKKLLTRTLRRELLDRAKKCLKGKYLHKTKKGLIVNNQMCFRNWEQNERNVHLQHDRLHHCKHDRINIQVLEDA
jgi:agmatine/peptidylarginine deiminase